MSFEIVKDGASWRTRDGRLFVRANAAQLAPAIEFRPYVDDRASGKLAIVRDIVFEEAVEGTYSPPAFVLDPEAAQRLMNDLWAAGVRPRDIGSIGELHATREHLEDMRRLAYTLLARGQDEGLAKSLSQMVSVPMPRRER